MARVSALAALFSLAILVVLGVRLFSGAEVGSAVAPDISIMAVDMNTAGNTSTSCAGQGCKPGTLGAIQTCAEVDPGSSIQVDIVVDSIPDVIAPSGAGPNIQGFDMDLIFSPAIVQVSAKNMLIGMEYQGTPGGGSSNTTDLTPDSDGDFFMSEIDFSSTGESGKGVLARLTIKGVASGVSTLHLHYTLLDTVPNIYDNSGAQRIYTIGTVLDSKIAVHPSTCPPATPTPTPSPVPTPGPSVTSPPTPSTTPVAVTPTIVPTPSPAPYPADIAMVGVDMDTTGNLSLPCHGNGCKPGVLGVIQDCAEVDPGGFTDMDIVVDSIPDHVTSEGIGPNILGFDMDLILDPSIVEVSAANRTIGMEYQGIPTDGFASQTEGPPNTDSRPWDFFMGEVDFGSTAESGKGILMRLTLKGLAPGISILHLQYTLVGSAPSIFDQYADIPSYSVGSVRDARIAVNPSKCTDPFPPAAVGGEVSLSVGSGSSTPWTPLAVSLGGVFAVLAAGVWFGRRRWRR